MDQDSIVMLGGAYTIVIIAIIVLMVASVWKTFVKAGKPGWAAIIPIYNVVVLLEISGKPLWWLILLIIPLVSLVFGILLLIALANSFGKSSGFGVGLALLGFVFFPILGFGDAKYRGPRAAV